MILHAICVEGWRCFAGRTFVGEFTEGLNIIFGPNGSGKSTLMMALVRGLFDNHLVSGEHISALRPWGRELNPQVTLEFTHGGVRYRLVKQFLASQRAELCRLEGGTYVRLAESRAADDQARRLLAGEAPGKGVTDPRHWGLAQVLWATQGDLRIADLSAPTRTAIEEALGHIAGPSTEAIERRIAEAYGQFFTRGGKLKRGAGAPAVVRLQEDLEKLQQKQQALQQRLEDFENASRRIEDLRSRAAAAHREEMELVEQLRRARERAQSYKQLLGERRLHRQEVDHAEERYKNLSDRIRDIASCRNEIAGADQQIERLGENSRAQAKLVQQAREAAEETQRAVGQVRMGRGELQKARQLAQEAARYAAEHRKLAELRKQIDKVETVRQELAQLRSARQRILAPDAEMLARIRQTARARDDARLQLDAAMITVTIEPEIALPVQVTLGEHPGTWNLPPGSAHAIRGESGVEFRIRGVGRFRASGPTGSAAQLRDTWEKASDQLRELMSAFGTDDLDELEQRAGQASELEGQVGRAQERLETLLGGRPFEALPDERDQLERGLQWVLGKHPEWKASPPDPEQLQRAADEQERQFTEAMDQADREWDRAQNALHRELHKEGEIAGQINALQRRREDLQKQLDALCGDGWTDPQRESQLMDLAMRRDAARGKLEAADQKLAEFGDDPESEVTNLERQLEAVREEKGEAEKELHTQSGRLQEIATEAPYSALAVAEEEIARLQEELVREQLHIDAIRLLYETLRQQKRQITDSVMGPLRQRASHLLRRIAGTRLQDICFDQSLLPWGVAPRSLGEPVPVDEVSCGEREQLYFAVRLALASVVFQEDRQLVVLDDVFAYTDTARLARIAAILQEAAERFQIVLLTCHPERYRGLPNAMFFDLEKIGGAASAASGSHVAP